MKRNFTTPGIILRSRNVGEKNKLLDILTPDRGIVRATAFGALSARSKLRSATQLFFSGEMFFYEDPVKGFIKLSDADIHYEFNGIRSDLKRLYAASLMGEILNREGPGSEGDPDTYRLLFACLTSLDRQDSDPAAVAVAAMWRQLELAGEQPEIPRRICVDPASIWHYHLGESEFGSHPNGGPIIRGADARLLYRPTTDILSHSQLILGTDGARNRLFHLLSRIFEYRLSRRLRSLEPGLLP